MSTSITTTLEAAQHWISKGRAVFPLRPYQKIPATGHGFKDASTDPEQIRAWFSNNNAYNLGLPTGNGLLAIDVDMKGGVNGLESLRQLEQEYGELPATLKVQTPSGGFHLFFNYPASLDIRGSAGKPGGKNAPGVDIRANGGYVAAVPSQLENGVYRTVIEQPIAELPGAWLSLLYKPPEVDASTSGNKPSPPLLTGTDQQLDDLHDALKWIDAHDHDTWVKVGMALHNLGDTGLHIWDDWSRTANNYSAKEIPKRWKSFRNASVNTETVFYLAQQKGWQNPRKGQSPSDSQPDQSSDSSSHDDHKPQASVSNLVEMALEQAEQQQDITALQDDTVLEALKQVRVMDELAYQRYRTRIQNLKQKPFSLPFLDKETKPPKKPRYTEQSEDGGDGGQNRQGKADLLIEMVRQWGELFTDESDTPYISFFVEPTDRETGEVLPGHVETWTLHSDKFQQKVGREFYRRFGTVAGDTAIKEALSVLAAEADENLSCPVYLRYGKHPSDERIYIDLCNEDWQVVEVSASGWTVIPSEQCPVKFRRVRHARPLPLPEPGGDMMDLWEHLNVQGGDSRLLVLAWLLESMRVDTPKPVLEIVAGQGSAKSTSQERLKILLDPNHSNLRKEPDSLRDLSISSASNWMISLNNLSHLSTSQQDFLCSMATGGGDAARQLYSTADEAVWDIRRPVALNGVSQLVTRPDLADRCVCLELNKISTYTDEQTLKIAWERDYPKLTGSLYTLLAGVLRELPQVELHKPPRMADFAKLGTAMVKALGRDVDFVAVFNRNRDAVVRRGVEASPVALALLGRMNVYGEFNGTLAELMEILDGHAPKHFDRTAWPKSPRGLGELLRRLEPALLIYGIEVERLNRGKQGYVYRICKVDTQTDMLETEL